MQEAQRMMRIELVPYLDAVRTEVSRPRSRDGWEIPALAALALLDRVVPGLLMLRSDDSIGWMNESAKQLFADGDLELLFRFLREREASRLTTASGKVVMVTRIPLELPSLDKLGKSITAAIMLTLLEERPVTPRPGVLQLLFGLTPAEARVAVAITSGSTIRETAEDLCVAESTVRSQLRAAFGKLGVRRQAELVQRVIAVATLRLDLRV